MCSLKLIVIILQHPGSSWGFGALLKDTSVMVLKEDTTVV